MRSVVKAVESIVIATVVLVINGIFNVNCASECNFVQFFEEWAKFFKKNRTHHRVLAIDSPHRIKPTPICNTPPGSIGDRSSRIFCHILSFYCMRRKNDKRFSTQKFLAKKKRSMHGSDITHSNRNRMSPKITTINTK